MPQIHRPNVTNNVPYMTSRNVVSWMKRRYDEIMAALVKAIALAYSTWQMRRYYRMSDASYYAGVSCADQNAALE
jgi:hypothetical protein